MVKYVCNICGYNFEGESAPVSCPVCGADKTQFTKASIVMEKEINEVNKNAFIEHPSKSYGSRSSWNDWEYAPVGHRQIMLALSSLREHTDKYRNKLENARRDLEKEKDKSRSAYQSLSSNINKQFDDDRNRFIIERDSMVHKTRERKESSDHVVDGSSNFATNINGVGINKINEKTRSSMNYINNHHEKVLQAIEAKVKAYYTLCECKIKEAENSRNQLLDNARAEQLKRDNKAEYDYDVEYNKICKLYSDDIDNGFNKDSILSYKQSIESSRFNAENYECRTEIPDKIMLGNIGFILPNRTEEEKKVVHTVEFQTSMIGEKDWNEYVIKMPYAQCLSDGISLLMRYEPSERSYVQNLMQPLLLNLFLSFPAGKLEATMIDPLDFGSNFSDILKLAEETDSARIIDTKIWGSEKDIENAIATLRQELENISSAYGTDKASRLKKEIIRVLAITDFPVGFNDSALKNLHAIVRNSAKLGVCVFISANDVELDRLKQRNENLVAEITQSLIETKSHNKRLMFVDPRYDQMFLQIDEMQDVIDNKERIFAIMCKAIKNAPQKVENFSGMYKNDIYDSNNWFTGEHNFISIPIGIKGANTVVKLELGKGGGSTEHHVLIAGLTGAGKSTLLHTLIMSTLISYSPEEIQLYILDFKEGVEFSPYTQYRLPSLRVVAINSEREFGLAVLKELCTELENRIRSFNGYGVSDITEYRKLYGVPPIPKLILVFDEIQELFRSGSGSDSISSECLSCINRLVLQGRAVGIHIILACQNFRNCPGLEAYFNNMSVRIAIKGSEEGSASILNADNDGAQVLQKKNYSAGSAIYNGAGGAATANNFFQISIIRPDERKKLLTCLDEYYSDPNIAPFYKKQQTRILLTNAEDNIYNCINRLIFEGAMSIEKLGTSDDGYGLMLGQNFGKKSFFIPELRRMNQDNMLVVTKDEKMALALFEMSAMSLLYEELHTKADKTNMLIYIVDLFAGELEDLDCDFDFIQSQFQSQVEIAKVSDMENCINDIYNTIIARSEGNTSSEERIFLLFFGVDRARKLRNRRIYDDDKGEEISTTEMLQRILSSGPKYGINSIVWGESVRGIENILGSRYEDMFNKRIAYELDDKLMDLLVAEEDIKSLYGKTAVYMDIENDIKNTHFRPYEIPSKKWVEEYAVVYEKVINEIGGCL